LPLKALLETVGVNLETFAPATQNDKGGKAISAPAQSDFGAFLQQKGEFITLVRINENGPAQLSGLSAGDQIIAVNHIRLSLQQFENLLRLKVPKATLKITAFRRDELMTFDVVLGEPECNIALLSNINESPNKKAAWPNALKEALIKSNNFRLTKSTDISPEDRSNRATITAHFVKNSDTFFCT